MRLLNSSSHHEGGLVSTQVGLSTVLSHVCFLRCHIVLLLLLDPGSSNREDETLQAERHSNVRAPIVSH